MINCRCGRSYAPGYTPVNPCVYCLQERVEKLERALQASNKRVQALEENVNGRTDDVILDVRIGALEERVTALECPGGNL
jgi:hypothetical protein